MSMNRLHGLWLLPITDRSFIMINVVLNLSHDPVSRVSMCDASLPRFITETDMTYQTIHTLLADHASVTALQQSKCVHTAYTALDE